MVPHVHDTNVDSEIITMKLNIVSTDCLLLWMLQRLHVVAIPLAVDLGHNLVDMEVPLSVVPDD